MKFTDDLKSAKLIYLKGVLFLVSGVVSFLIGRFAIGTMDHMTAELSEINEKLKGIITDQDAQIRLVIQTGCDETGMVATADGYLRLAQVLIEFILKAKAQETEIWNLYGHSLPGSTAINDLFRENYEVCIDTISLAETQEEVSAVAQAFWEGSPPNTS